MRAVVSRVTWARVTVDDAVVGELDAPGLLVLLGVHRDDGPEAPGTMARKLHELRLLRGERSDGEGRGDERSDGEGRGDERSDGEGRGDERSCAETGAGLLVISQFTLYGDTRRGRRPSWSAAAPPARAREAVDAVVTALRARGAPVAEGRFGADMCVESRNDGPFTVLVET